MMKVMVLASMFAFVGTVVYLSKSPIAYALCGAVAVGGVVVAYRKARKAVGSDGFSGDLPPHVKRALEAKNK